MFKAVNLVVLGYISSAAMAEKQSRYDILQSDLQQMIENGIDIAIENSATSVNTDDTDATASADDLVSMEQVPFSQKQKEMFFDNAATQDDIKNMFKSEPDWKKYPKGLKREAMKMYFKHSKSGGPVYDKLLDIDNNPLLDKIMAAKNYEEGDKQFEVDWLMAKSKQSESLFGSYHFDVPALCRSESEFQKNKYRLHKREVWIFPTKAHVVINKLYFPNQVHRLIQLEDKCKIAEEKGTYDKDCCYENMNWMTGFMRVIKYYQHDKRVEGNELIGDMNEFREGYFIRQKQRDFGRSFSSYRYYNAFIGYYHQNDQLRTGYGTAAMFRDQKLFSRGIFEAGSSLYFTFEQKEHKDILTEKDLEYDSKKEKYKINHYLCPIVVDYPCEFKQWSNIKVQIDAWGTCAKKQNFGYTQHNELEKIMGWSKKELAEREKKEQYQYRCEHTGIKTPADK